MESWDEEGRGGMNSGKGEDWPLEYKSVFSFLYVSWQHDTARIRPPLLQQSIDISCPPGPQQQTCSSGFAACGPVLGQTDRRTETVLFPFYRPCNGLHALHTMRAVQITIKLKALKLEARTDIQIVSVNRVNCRWTNWCVNRRLHLGLSSNSRCLNTHTVKKVFRLICQAIYGEKV